MKQRMAMPVAMPWWVKGYALIWIAVTVGTLVLNTIHVTVYGLSWPIVLSSTFLLVSLHFAVRAALRRSTRNPR